MSSHIATHIRPAMSLTIELDGLNIPCDPFKCFLAITFYIHSVIRINTCVYVIGCNQTTHMTW